MRDAPPAAPTSACATSIISDVPTAPQVTRAEVAFAHGSGPLSALRPVAAGDLIGRHRVVAELGRGGMGRVFAAHDVGLHRLVAIKLIVLASPAMVARFMTEARVTARCTHPNIVVVHEIAEHHGTPYMVLEHLAGESLATRLRRGPVSAPQAVSIMLGVARALACAHSHGIVHRDLKPSNIVVTTDGA